MDLTDISVKGRTIVLTVRPFIILKFISSRIFLFSNHLFFSLTEQSKLFFDQQNGNDKRYKIRNRPGKQNTKDT